MWSKNIKITETIERKKSHREFIVLMILSVEIFCFCLSIKANLYDKIVIYIFFFCKIHISEQIQGDMTTSPRICLYKIRISYFNGTYMWNTGESQNKYFTSIIITGAFVSSRYMFSCITIFCRRLRDVRKIFVIAMNTMWLEMLQVLFSENEDIFLCTSTWCKCSRNTCSNKDSHYYFVIMEVFSSPNNVQVCCNTMYHF